MRSEKGERQKVGRKGGGEKKGEGRKKGRRGESLCVVRGCKMATQMALGRTSWAMG